MTVTFNRPLRATEHCRHYSYETGLYGRGPLCALGVDLSGAGASRRCWPTPEQVCDKREDYTDDERNIWNAWLYESQERLGRAVQALPAPIPLNTDGWVKCPNCDGGHLHYARWHRGAQINCSTPNCCGPVHFSIASGKDWPTPKGGE
jgi:hypothetical protein